MSMSGNFHDVRTVRADIATSGNSWLNIEDGKGSYIAVHMPYAVACAMAEAYASATAPVDIDAPRIVIRDMMEVQS